MPLKSFTETEIILTERQRLEMPLLVLILLGVGAFSLAEGNIFYLLCGFIAVGVNIFAVKRQKEIYLHRVFVNACVLVATASLLIEVVSSHVTLLSAIGHYLILIQLCKLFERKTNRDYIQMVVMSMMLIVAAALVAAAPWFVIVMVVYGALICHTAMVFTLKQSLDAAASARLATESGPLAPLRVAWNVIRAWPGKCIKACVFKAVPLMLLIGGIVFIAAPRSPLISRSPYNSADESIMTGFINQVKLGQPNRIYLSRQPVMRVSFPWGKPPLPIYLRGKTFSIYRDSVWSNRTQPDSATENLSSPSEELLKDARQAEILMTSSLLPDFFSIFPTIQVQSEMLTDIRISPESFLINLDTVAIQPQAVSYTISYLPVPLSESHRNYLATVSPKAGETAKEDDVFIGPEVEKLGNQWCEDLLRQRLAEPQKTNEINLAIAARIASRLEGLYQYSLDLSDADPQRDGVEDFLFRMRKGHCEYFASALTVLCRAMDVRARLVAGFRVDSPAKLGDSYIVRQSDAHAWVEVYTSSSDWVVFDPSPSAAEIQKGGVLKKFQGFWEDFSFLWAEKVAGYDYAMRNRLNGWLGAYVTAAMTSVKAAMRAILESMENLFLKGTADLILIGIVVAIGAAGIVLEGVLFGRIFMRKFRIRRELKSFGLTQSDIGFIVRLFRLLARRGFGKKAGQTPLEAALVAAEKLSLPSETLRDLVEFYYSLRWGAKPGGRAAISAAEEKVRHIKKMLST